jgi:low temperature requirement protein LtrA
MIVPSPGAELVALGPVLRRPDQEHRAATTLELLFDLCFVVAVAQVASGLHHRIAEGRIGDGVLAYLMIFGAVWWAWMNFTWFASAHDSDDVAYRVLVLVQMAGVLTLAAGVPKAYEGDWRVITAGYVIMRLSLVLFWWWVGYKYAATRAMCLRYAAGISVLQVGWIGVNFLQAGTGTRVLIHLSLFACELAVPIWAELSYRQIHWHREHIVERYGLFTIIVLGEAILSATVAIQSSAAEGGLSGSMVSLAIGGLITAFAVWWLYFSRPRREGPHSLGAGIVWGYSHLLLWAAVAAFGAGLQVAAEALAGHGSVRTAGLSVSIPIAGFLLALVVIYRFGVGEASSWFQPALVTAALLLLISGLFASIPVTVIGSAIVMTSLVAMTVSHEGAPGVGEDALLN